MKTFAGLVAIALAFAPAVAHADGFISLNLGLPGPPSMTVVAPGIRVVEGVGEEVFFNGGFYWCRRGDGWYRSRSLNGRFGWVEGRYVPGGMRGFPEGRYRNWHHDGWQGDGRRGEGRGAERREIRHEERREERREDRREERRDDRRGDRHDEEHRH